MRTVAIACFLFLLACDGSTPSSSVAAAAQCAAACSKALACEMTSYGNAPVYGAYGFGPYGLYNNYGGSCGYGSSYGSSCGLSELQAQCVAECTAFSPATRRDEIVSCIGTRSCPSLVDCFPR